MEGSLGIFGLRIATMGNIAALEEIRKCCTELLHGESAIAYFWYYCFVAVM